MSLTTLPVELVVKILDNLPTRVLNEVGKSNKSLSSIVDQIKTDRANNIVSSGQAEDLTTAYHILESPIYQLTNEIDVEIPANVLCSLTTGTYDITTKNAKNLLKNLALTYYKSTPGLRLFIPYNKPVNGVTPLDYAYALIDLAPSVHLYVDRLLKSSNEIANISSGHATRLQGLGIGINLLTMKCPDGDYLAIDLYLDPEDFGTNYFGLWRNLAENPVVAKYNGL